MTHMIFELFVSSARICAYIPASPGACAGNGMAASSKKQSTHPNNFATVPPAMFLRFNVPRSSRNSRLRSNGRPQIYARVLRRAILVPRFGRLPLRCRCARALRSFGFSSFRFSAVGPASQQQRDCHAGVAQFIRITAVGHRTRYHHSSHTQRSDGLRLVSPRPAVSCRAPLQYAHHGSKNRLERPFRSGAAARYVGRQRRHRARILHVLKVLPRQISPHYLRAHIAGRQIHFDSFPATFPFRVRKEAAQDLDVQIALALEITVKAAVRQPGSGHNLVERNAVKSVAVEEPPRALHNLLSHLVAVSCRIWHFVPLFCRAEVSLMSILLFTKILS